MIGLSPGVEIINACRLLFPTAAVIDAGFLNAIADADVKSAFRKSALKTHPDRSQALGRSPEELNRLFQELSSAYQILQTYCLQRPPVRPGNGTYQRVRPRRFSAGSGRFSVNDYYYSGALPQRRLRLGEYLYYSKMISWRTLIGAIVWQKRRRPLFGEIARQWNFLSDDEIRLILKMKNRGEMFGECARRYGFLSPFQLLAVTGRQRRLQPPIGAHFIEKGLLSVAQVQVLVGRKDQHNRRLRYN